MAELTRRELILALAAVPNVDCRPPHHLVRLAGVDLSGLDLRGLNLAHADLAGADLRGCDLTDARLYESDLSGADLTGAVLRGVYAERASFVAALLAGADFRRSERNLFYGTCLSGADFRGADLRDARFAGADLCGADFRDGRLAGADFYLAKLDRHTRFSGPPPCCEPVRHPPAGAAGGPAAPIASTNHAPSRRESDLDLIDFKSGPARVAA